MLDSKSAWLLCKRQGFYFSCIYKEGDIYVQNDSMRNNVILIFMIVIFLSLDIDETKC